jgi:hypothetical protein
MFSASFGIAELDYYKYLCHGGNNNRVDGTNDAHDFQETLQGALTFLCLSQGSIQFFQHRLNL